MSKQRFTWLLVAAVVALSAALYLAARRNSGSETTVLGGPLLPGLASEANTITSLTVRRGSTTPTVTVHQTGGIWTVAERGEYPADVSKVRKLVLALSDAKIVEEKTSDPAKFPVIGVEDPSAAGATGAEIGVTAKNGKHAVIIGKSASGEGNFARRSGENRSYIVEPAVSFEAEPKYWIEPGLLDIATTSIQSVEVKPATGTGYALRRAPTPPAATAPPAAPAPAPATATPSPTTAPATTTTGSGSSGGTGKAAAAPAALTGNFSLEGVPAGRKAAEAASLAPSPSTLSALTADDIVPASNVDFTKPALATFTMADGSTLTVTSASSGDKHWIELKSSKDAALNAKVAGRAFEIASYRYDSIFRPLDQLLVPKEPPPSAAKSSAASPAPTPKKKPQSTPAS